MNGARTVRWMIEHGFKEYPIIGLSSQQIDDLDPDVRNFFLITNARYFYKPSVDFESLIEQIAFNADYIRQNHEKWL